MLSSLKTLRIFSFGMVEDVSLSSVLDSGSIGNKGVKIVSSGRKCCIQSRRVKVVHSQPEYAS